MGWMIRSLAKTVVYNSRLLLSAFTLLNRFGDPSGGRGTFRSEHGHTTASSADASLERRRPPSMPVVRATLGRQSPAAVPRAEGAHRKSGSFPARHRAL